MISKSLAYALQIKQACVPKDRIRDLKTLLSQTSMQEREALYAIARYSYSGDGDIFDIGALAGGSAFCLAAGVVDSDLDDKTSRVHSFDLFRGHALNVFQTKLQSTPPINSDLELFLWQTRHVKNTVIPHQMDLLTDFDSFKLSKDIEIAHIDAAKSLSLWKAIFRRISTTIIPNKTIWVFHYFERIRLPWQIYGLNALRRYGHFIGGSTYGTLCFRFNEPISYDSISKIAHDDFTLAERLRGIEELFEIVESQYSELFQGDWPIEDLKNGAFAYCYLYVGDRENARKCFSETSKAFRAHRNSNIYCKEIGLSP